MRRPAYGVALGYAAEILQLDTARRDFWFLWSKNQGIPAEFTGGFMIGVASDPDIPLESRLREACAELDRRIRNGEECRAEQYVMALRDSGADADRLMDLIYTEYLAREGRGEILRADDWYQRFPEWRDSLARLFELHELARDTSPRTVGHSTLVSDDSASRFTSAANLAGCRIGQYELLEKIGQGGMGVVYRARQLNLDRVVAIKMILTVQATSLQRARFNHEAETVARLHHPNIVQIHEVGEENGCAFLSMEFVDGKSLDQTIAESQFTARAAATLVETLARAMHYAHGLGIIHRDLKPANVILATTRSGPNNSLTLDQDTPQSVLGPTPKITDFGLAKHLNFAVQHPPGSGSAGLNGNWLAREAELTATGQILGTPGYMAPEQTTGTAELIGPSTDVYGLGAILYATLCGHAPFRGATVLETIEMVRTQDPLPPRRLVPAIPRDLETICLKSLAKEPARRYATAERLAADLCCFLEGHPIQARPIGQIERAVKWARRRPTAAALVMALVGVFAGVTWQWIRAETSRAQAVAAATKADLANRAEQNAREHAEQLLYAHDVALASHEYKNNNTDRALQLLDGTRVDLRHWEWRILNRFCRGEQRTLKIDTRENVSLAFSSDGRLIAGDFRNADGTGETRVWDSGTCVEKYRFSSSPSVFSSVGIAFSPDSKRLLTCGGDGDVSVRLWDMSNGSEVLRITDGRVINVAFSPDGKLLACGRGDGKVGIYRADSAEKLGELSGHRGLVLGVAFSPDGTCLASAGRDGTARIWDAALLTEVENITGLRDARCLDYSPDGTRLAIGTWYGFVKIYDLTERGACVRTADSTPQVKTFSRTANIPQLAWSPDGQRLAVVIWGNGLELWDAQTGQQQRVLNGDHARACFSPDGRQLATAGYDRFLRIWDVTATPQPSVSMPHPTGALISGIVFCKDPQQAAFAAGGRSAYRTSLRDYTLRIVDVSARQVLKELRGHTSWLTGVAMSPDGRRIVTSSADKTLRIWDVNASESIQTLSGHLDAVTCVATSDIGSLIASGSNDKSIRIWNGDDGHELRVLQGHSDEVRAIAFQPGGQVLASGDAAGTIRIWDLATGNLLADWRGHTSGVKSIEFSSPAVFGSCCGDSQIQLWDIGSVLAGDTTPARTLDAHAQDVSSLCFTPDGKRLASVGFRTVKLWDVATGQELLGLPATANQASRIRFSGDGRYLAMSQNYELSLWDPEPSNEGADSDASRAIAWHTQQSDNCETLRDWFGVAFHRGQLAQLQPGEWLQLVRRGDAFARLSRWDQAAHEFDLAVEHGADRYAWYLRALVHMLRKDAAAYRATCEGMIESFGEIPDPAAANSLAWTCALSSASGVDSGRLVELAKVAVQNDRIAAHLNTLGACLYRAGRFEESRDQLTEAIELHGEGGDPADWLFLAMALHACGQTTEARAQYQQAARWIDSGTIELKRSDALDAPMHWTRLIELSALRDEAARRLAQ